MGATKKREIQEEIDELKEDYRLILKKSENSSTVGRQISFALLAVTWALIYDQHTFRFHILLGISAIILLLYLLVDLIQYYYAAMRLKHLLYWFQTEDDDQNDEKKAVNYKTDKWKLSQKVNMLYNIKFVLLGIALISLLCYIIGVLSGIIVLKNMKLACCGG
jgi:hypothetical protein